MKSTIFERRNFASPSVLPLDIPRTIFLRQKRLEEGDLFGLELHFCLAKDGRLKYQDHDAIDKDSYVISNGAEVIIISGNGIQPYTH